MSKLKISSDLFLGTPELIRLQEFMSDKGYVQGLLNNSVSFGLIKNDNDPSFNNAKVSADSDISIGGNTLKTVKINPILGFDKFGNFLAKEITNQLPIPNDGKWHWIRISYIESHAEKGLWNLASDGTLTGSGGELTKILRGQPNFPSRIRFLNSEFNTSDYDILEVTDDNNAILNAVNFQAESNLQLAVVGTFTYGSPIDPANKLIFNYDSCKIELIAESVTNENTRPTTGFESGRTFYIARVRVDGSNVIIQDKRLDYWETKASFKLEDISVSANPLIGIEAIKFDHPYTTRNKNVVEMAWSFRSSSWSVNTETNVVTLSAGQGGKFKTINDFTNGDFNGWRLYTPDGRYSRIITSTKQGNAIDLKLDILDVDSYSNDGGNTFLQNQFVVVAPNAEAIEITFTPDPNDNVNTQIQKFEFEINERIGRCDILAYEDVTLNGIPNVGGNYNVSYRYRNFLTYSPSRAIPSDNIGYYNELAFDENGNFLPDANNHRQPFTTNSTQGFVIIRISPNAYKNFNFKVDKGDLIGMQKYTTLSGLSTINLIVGQTFHYIYFSGNLTLTSDLVILLDTSTDIITNGNEFKIHFNANSMQLNGHVINIRAGAATLKTMTDADFYMMKNVDDGIIISAKCDGQTWYLSQNYDLGRSGEIVTVVGLNGQSATDYFDANGWGRVKGYFGYHIADGRDNTFPLNGRFPVGYDANDADYYEIGQTGGSKRHKLTKNEQGSFQVKAVSDRSEGSSRNNTTYGFSFKAASDPNWTDLPNGSGANVPIGPITVNIGDAPTEHENRPPYMAVLFAQKMF